MVSLYRKLFGTVNPRVVGSSPIGVKIRILLFDI